MDTETPRFLRKKVIPPSAASQPAPFWRAPVRRRKLLLGNCFFDAPRGRENWF